MSRPFSFVHAADLHIASPFIGLTAEAQDLARALGESTFTAYEAMIDLCVEREVDFALIAGDVYDSRDRSLRAQLAFRDGLQRLSEAGIRAFVVHGNHDPLDGRMTSLLWPETATVFGSEGATAFVEIEGDVVASVTGASFPTAKVDTNLAAALQPPDGDHFNIGLLHCSVGTNPGHETYAPCAIEDLSNSDFHYWALGHVHSRQVLADDPWVVYPGNLQGRSFHECGPRGCYLVTVAEDRGVDLEFVACDQARFGEIRVAIDGLSTVTELERRIGDAVAKETRSFGKRPGLLRITVDGRGPLYTELRAENAAADLLEHLRAGLDDHRSPRWIQRIRLECRPEVDLEQRRQAGDLLAEVLKVAADLEGGTLEEALAATLDDLYGTQRVSRVISPPHGEDLSRLLSEAQLLCLDLLED